MCRGLRDWVRVMRLWSDWTVRNLHVGGCGYKGGSAGNEMGGMMCRRQWPQGCIRDQGVLAGLQIVAVEGKVVRMRGELHASCSVCEVWWRMLVSFGFICGATSWCMQVCV